METIKLERNFDVWFKPSTGLLSGEWHKVLHETRTTTIKDVTGELI